MLLAYICTVHTIYTVVCMETDGECVKGSAITYTSRKQTPVVHLSLLYLWTYEERMGGEWKESVVLASLLKVSLAFYQQLLVG